MCRCVGSCARTNRIRHIEKRKEMRMQRDKADATDPTGQKTRWNLSTMDEQGRQNVNTYFTWCCSSTEGGEDAEVEEEEDKKTEDRR